MSRTIVLATLLLVLITGVSLQAQDGFREWDRDQDGYITDYEFQVQLQSQEYFKTFDFNEDGMLDREEWAATCRKCDYLKDQYFKKWDIDGNNYLYEDEFIKGVYNTWDSDSDGYLGHTEYAAYHVDWEVIR